MVDHVGGDAVVRGIDADVCLRHVGGDLMLGGVAGSIEATAGGDAVVNLLAVPGSHTQVQTGSDLSCQLPEHPSVILKLMAGGELHHPGDAVPTRTHRISTAKLG